MVGHVEFDHMGIAALPFDASAQLLEFFDPAAGQHHSGASTGQGAGKLSAQAAGGAGDKSHAAGQIDAVCHLESPYWIKIERSFDCLAYVNTISPLSDTALCLHWSK
ncbi:hypothetical protein D3C71_1600110 [compost metagenome]